MAYFTQYCTLQNVKDYPGAPITDAGSDLELARIVDAIKNSIDSTCRWSFNDESRTDEEIGYPAVKVDNDGYLQIRVEKCPVTSVTSVAYRFKPSESWTTVDASLVEFYPTPTTVPYPRANSNLVKCYVNLYSQRAYGSKPRVKITYRGGFQLTDPPPALQQLAVRLAWWRFKQKDAPFEKTAVPALGQIIIPAALPNDVRMDLEQWSRWA